MIPSGSVYTYIEPDLVLLVEVLADKSCDCWENYDLKVLEVISKPPDSEFPELGYEFNCNFTKHKEVSELKEWHMFKGQDDEQ